MANVDAAFIQKIFHIPQRERKPHIYHNGQADDLGVRLEVTIELCENLTQFSETS
jgi:hypothetical protein